LPKLAIDQSFNQKHPSNNDAGGFFRCFPGVQPPNPSEPHDVGSEYAVYMVVSPVKLPFAGPGMRATAGAPSS
jgi:hypothetical protein